MASLVSKGKEQTSDKPQARKLFVKTNFMWTSFELRNLEPFFTELKNLPSLLFYFTNMMLLTLLILEVCRTSVI